jgi:hypothetical protein
MLRSCLVGALALVVSVGTAGAQTDSTMKAKGDRDAIE